MPTFSFRLRRFGLYGLLEPVFAKHWHFLLPAASQTLAKGSKRIRQVLPVFPSRKCKLQVVKNGVETDKM